MAFTPIVSSQTVTGETVSSGTQSIVNGGIANNEIINSGGSQNISSGGMASATVIYSYGYQNISSGGMTSNTIISAGGSQTISSGGMANNTTVNSGGWQWISSGATASMINQQSGAAIVTDTGATITSGTNIRTDGHSKFSIISGVASNFLLDDFGQLTVLSGNSAVNTVITSGNLIISSGGVANNTTIYYYGHQYISSGGMTNDTIVDRGWQYIYAGGMASATTINNGDQNVCGVANSTTINGGNQDVYFGGVANITVINSGGKQDVGYGGMANSTTINSGGSQVVWSGGANFTIIGSGGSQRISSGCSANVINQQSGAAIIADTGATITGGTNARTDGHSAFSIVSGVASNFLLENGGYLTIWSGHSAVDTVIAYGCQNIYSGGTANFATINSGGTQLISYGGVANSTIMKNGSQYIYFGGTANSTVISSGKMWISSGGTANVINQQSGAAIITNTGATITSGTNTRTGGHSAFFIISGVASNFLLTNGGKLSVLSGHSATETVIAYGQQWIAPAGTANSTTINSGGFQYVFGTDNHSVINSGGILMIGNGGSSIDFNLSAGGILGWDFNATISGTSSGTATVSSSGKTSYNLYLLDNATQYVSSGCVAGSTSIQIGGSQIISSGGLANATTINSSGNQIIYSGGTANGTIIKYNGNQAVSCGGTANATTVEGYQCVFFSGTANSNTINYGFQRVSSGGTVNLSIINSGGSQTVWGGGVANSDTINSGGCVVAYSGGIANSTTINSSGSQYVEFGGKVNNTIINSGGIIIVSSGGIVSSTLTVAGGHVVLANAASVSGLTTISYVLATANVNDVLVTVYSGTLGAGTAAYSLNLDDTAAGSYILADGIDLTGLNGKTFSVTDNGQTVNLTVGSSYTFDDGDTLTLNFTDSTRDQLTAVFNDGSMAFTLIVSSQTVTGETVSSGTQSIINSGIANSTNINASGYQDVCSGGVTNSTTINSSGYQNVSSGGIANYTAINDYGYQEICSGGVANSTAVNSGGYQQIYSGGVANSTAVNSGGYQEICSGGATNRTTINSSGCQCISSGGVANSTTINAGGYQGGVGVINFTTISSGGAQSISSSGVANFTTISSGGYQSVLSGGSASVINQQAGAAIRANTGATITGGTNTRTDGHSAFSIVNGVASNFLLENYGQLVVLSGHSAIDTVISSCGWQNVYSGGMANSTTINGGGQGIYDGVASTTIVNSGGSQIISSGGIACVTTINSGGYQNISSGGVASNTIVNSTGNMYVSSGGIANSTNINAGGHQNISSGGVTNSTTINSDGWQQVYSGGTAANTIVNSDGFMCLGDGGTAISTVINSGGWLSGGTATSTIINSGGYQYAGGIASQSMVRSGGILMIGESGSAVGFNMSSGGILGWNFNAVLSGTSNGVAIVSSSGKTSYNLYLMKGATQNVSSGYTADSTVISSGGNQKISSGGMASSTIVYSGGWQHVLGLASSTTINFGGSQSVWNGAVANLTIINSGGSQNVGSGGTASGAIINSGGYMYVISGGIVSGALTIAGGHVMMAYSDNLQPAAMNFVLATAKTGDALLTINSGAVGDISHTAFTLDVNNTANGTYILGAGADLAGMGGAVFTVKDNGQSVNVQVGSSYTFADGDKLTLGLADAATDQLTAAFTAGSGSALPQITIAATDADAGEPANDGTFRISRTGDTSNALTVYFNVNGTATAGSDYTLRNGSTALTGSAVIAAGQAYADVTLDVIDNAAVENTETAVMNLTANAAYTLGATTSATVNITDNDVADPVLPTVPDGLKQTVTGNRVALDWDDSTDLNGIKQYELQVDNNNNFSSLEYFKRVAVSQTSLEGVKDGTYYWRIRAQDNSGNYSAWSAARSFSMELVPPTVPAGLKQTVTGSSVAFDWNDSTDASGITQYELRVDKSSDFSSPEYTESFTASQGTEVNIPLGAYYWQVRSQDNAGNYSAWSKSSSFVVTPSDTAANDYKTAKNISDGVDNWVGYGDAADCYELTLTGAGLLTLSLTGLSGNADLSLLNSSGKVLKTSANKDIAGEAINDFALLAGDYYIKVASAKGVNSAGYTLNNSFSPFPEDNAGSTPGESNVIGELEDEVVVERNDWVGFGDPADYYLLTLTNAGTLSLNLTGLSRDANLTLLD
ncbi:MAG: AIDA repeat-containing protein, partial [Victivallaceae bacterium]